MRPSAPMTQCLTRHGAGASPPARGAAKRRRTEASASATVSTASRRWPSATVPGSRPRRRASVSRAHVMPICGGRFMRADHPATSMRTSSSASWSSPASGSRCSMAMVRISAPARTTRSHVAASIARRWFSPCGQMKMATPAGLNASRCSNTRTSRPARWSARAAARPPGPAPTIATSHASSSRAEGDPGAAPDAAGRGRRREETPRRCPRGRAATPGTPAETARDIGKASARRGTRATRYRPRVTRGSENENDSTASWPNYARRRQLELRRDSDLSDDGSARRHDSVRERR